MSLVAKAETMGDRIRKLRRDANMTQEELAKRIGVQYQAVNKYEKGLVTNIPIERLEKIAFALNTTVRYIRYGTSDEWNESEIIYDPCTDYSWNLGTEQNRRRYLHAMIDAISEEQFEIVRMFLELTPGQQKLYEPMLRSMSER